MKCKFCGSSKAVLKNVQSETDPSQFGGYGKILHNDRCIAHRTEKELLLLILEKLDEVQDSN